MGLGEGLGHLDDLAVGTLGAEVDGGPDAHRAEVGGLLDPDEQDLVVGVRVVEEVVVVQLDDERDPVHIPARDDAETAEGGGDGVAVARDGEVAQAGRVEVRRELGEAGGGRVLDALVDGEDREVAGPGQAAGAVEGAEVAQYGRRAVRVREDVVDDAGSGQGEVARRGMRWRSG